MKTLSVSVEIFFSDESEFNKLDVAENAKRVIETDALGEVGALVKKEFGLTGNLMERGILVRTRTVVRDSTIDENMSVLNRCFEMLGELENSLKKDPENDAY